MDHRPHKFNAVSCFSPSGCKRASHTYPAPSSLRLFPVSIVEVTVAAGGTVSKDTAQIESLDLLWPTWVNACIPQCHCSSVLYAIPFGRIWQMIVFHSDSTRILPARSSEVKPFGLFGWINAAYKDSAPSIPIALSMDAHQIRNGRVFLRCRVHLLPLTKRSRSIRLGAPAHH